MSSEALSYPQRISAAEEALTQARSARDFYHPGSAEWQIKQGLVESWERALSELRQSARGE